MSFIAGQILLQIEISDKVWGLFFIWLFLTSFLSLLFLIADNNLLGEVKKPDVYIPISLALSIMTVLILLNESDLGFRKATGSDIEGNFRLPGFPILDYQVAITLIGIIGVFILIRWLVDKWEKGKKLSVIAVDIMIILCLIVGSFLITNSTPVIPNSFIDQPRPPNYTIAPNLDAEIYERTSQSLLAMGRMQTYIGEGDNLSIGRRPLLALYLALLHQVTGLGHDDILSIQLLFFSLVPVLIYIFTKNLHNRISATVAAVLMIFRHQNGLLLAHNVWGGANLQMIMSDFPAMMIVILFLILSIKWIKNFNENSLFPIIPGGIIGLGLLIRQEVLVLLPMVCIAALLGRTPRFKIILKQFFLLFISTVVVITPWITRNYVETGKIFLDKPSNRIEKIIHSISFGISDANKTDQDNLPVVDERDVLPIDLSSSATDTNQLTHFQLVGNHYANAFPQLFLYLPNNPLGLNLDYLQKMVNRNLEKTYGGVLYSPYKYAKSLPYWWFDQWDGKIDGKSWIYLSGVVGLISVGIYGVWKKERWIISLPLLAIFGMITIYALIQASGGRWLQTVDWLSAMFLSIGLVELSSHALDYWTGKGIMKQKVSGPDILKQYRDTPLSGATISFIFLGIVLLGASPVIAEIVIPNHYPESEMEFRLSSVLDEENPSLTNSNRDMLRNFLDQGGEVIYGRALYPRYFPPDASMMTTNQRTFPSSTTFTIAGTELNFVVLPSMESPISFPHGSDVLTFGCRETSIPPAPGFPCLGCITPEFDALAVIRFGEDDQTEDVYWRYGDYGDFVGCPMRWYGE